MVTAENGRDVNLCGFAGTSRKLQLAPPFVTL